jgi:hypothetical protein
MRAYLPRRWCEVRSPTGPDSAVPPTPKIRSIVSAHTSGSIVPDLIGGFCRHDLGKAEQREHVEMLFAVPHLGTALEHAVRFCSHGPYSSQFATLRDPSHGVSCSPVSKMSSPELTHLPATRRLVTGHDDAGKAVFFQDTRIHPFDPFQSSTKAQPISTPHSIGVTLIHRTHGFPVKIQGGEEELAQGNVKRGQGEPGVVCQIVDLPPAADAQPYLHRNQSLDYGVVLKGSMEIILEGGAKKTLYEGDVYVQK